MTPLTPSASDGPLPGAEGHHVGDAAAGTAITGGTDGVDRDASLAVSDR